VYSFVSVSFSSFCAASRKDSSRAVPFYFLSGPSSFVLRGLEDGPASVAGNALFHLAHLAFQYRSRNRCSVVAFARNRHPQPGICGESIKAVISSEPQLTVNDTDIRSYRNVRTITRWNKSPDNGRRYSYLRQFFASANRIYSTDEENLPLLT
jgi:hypothetical protein